MHTRIILCLDIILILSIMSCTDNEKNKERCFSDFPKHISLDGRAIEFPDSEQYNVGSVEIAGDGYMFYTYMTDHYLLMTDSTFSNPKPLAYKGEGPGEFTGVTGVFGQVIDSEGSLSVYDPKKICLYSFNPKNNYKLKEEISFGKDFTQYVPLSVVKNIEGKYIAIRGDYQYGMVSFDPKSKKVQKWPLGYNFKDINMPANEVISFRSMAYNEKNNACAEIYGCFPTVILHGTDGEIIGSYTYTGYSKDEKTKECYLDVDLTTNYVWLLYGDPDIDESSHVFVLDYAGNPIADLEIESAMRIAIDAKRHLIIGVTPRSDEADAMVYEIPKILGNL